MAVRITRAGVALTVGIILVTGLIIGGFFWARQSSEQARRNEAIKIAEQNLESLASEDSALNEGEENAESNESTTDSEESTSNESTPESNGSNSTENSSDSAQNEANVSELPTTGPESLASVVAIGALVFSITAYVQSRRSLQ